MLILLPPSETKRDGGADGTGSGTPLSLSELSFPDLTPTRKVVGSALRKLAGNLTSMAEALKLGPSQRGELLRNRTVSVSPTMPAMDRYTGVLYDGLDAQSLPAAAREFASGHVAIHSALFGLIGAGDPIPAYRLSHDSRIPGLSLKTLWSPVLTELLTGHDGLILDLRSESYAALGPAPKRDGSFYLRVVAEDAAGRRRALNHFNKKGKGEFTRALVLAGVDHPDADSLLEWAGSSGFSLSRGADGELDLVVANTLAG